MRDARHRLWRFPARLRLSRRLLPSVDRRHGHGRLTACIHPERQRHAAKHFDLLRLDLAAGKLDELLLGEKHVGHKVS